MSKINKNLILVSTILTFILGLFTAFPTYAYYVYTTNGAVFLQEETYPIRYTNPYDSTTNVNNISTNTVNNSNIVDKKETINTSKTINNSETSDVNSKTETNNTVSTNNTKENFNSLTANALMGSNSFMPNGLLQWIFFIVMIAAIIFLWRYVHRSEEAYMSEPMKHA